MYIESMISTLEGASIRNTLSYRKVMFLWFHLLYFLRNDQFFLEKVTKSGFKRCPFSQKLRVFYEKLLCQDL